MNYCGILTGKQKTLNTKGNGKGIITKKSRALVLFTQTGRSGMRGKVVDKGKEKVHHH